MQAVSQSNAITSFSSREEPSGDDTSLSTVMGGIIDDVQSLLEDHLHLMKLEVEEDLEESKAAIFPMVIGGVLMLTALFMLMAVLTGWLNWLYPDIPWFGWAAIIAGVVGVLSIVLLLVGKKKWQHVNPLPEKTLRRVKKSIQSINEQVNTDKS